MSESHGHRNSCRSEDITPYVAAPEQAPQDPRSTLLASLKELRQMQREAKAMHQRIESIADDVEDALEALFA